MRMKTIALVAVSNPAPRHAVRQSRLERLQARVRDVCRACLDRARARRQARRTALALANLGPRELRDIGLVRLVDADPVRYGRITDFE